MTLEDLGYNEDLENYRKEQNIDSFGVGRVILEHKERYSVKTLENEYDAEIIGNLRFTAQKRSDFPAVGDWVAISDSSGGFEKTFETIVELAKDCKFKDCTHTTEIDCVVLEALSKGEIDKDSYENYMKMEKEKEHFESTIAEKRKKDKDFGKMIKHYKKTRKSNKD